MDCMKAMPFIPDLNREVLAIVDPPYFKGPEKGDYYASNTKKHCAENPIYTNIKEWNPPEQNYFDILLKISKFQIIWGINYYKINYMGPGRIIWDKDNVGSNYSNCEIAYSNIISSVRIFKYKWRGMLQENMKQKEKKIHSTQKPVALYR